MIVGFILAMSWLAACFGLLVGSPEAANGATFALMFIPYLSTAFVPASSMTRVLRPVAANQPFTPVIETMRGLWMGHTSTGASVGHEALARRRLLRGHPRRRRDDRQLALPAPHGRPLTRRRRSSAGRAKPRNRSEYRITATGADPRPGTAPVRAGIAMYAAGNGMRPKILATFSLHNALT